MLLQSLMNLMQNLTIYLLILLSICHPLIYFWRNAFKESIPTEVVAVVSPTYSSLEKYSTTDGGILDNIFNKQAHEIIGNIYENPELLEV